MSFNVDGDRPITKKDDDRLGFAPVAEQLAHAIADQPAREGLVFGIEGKWGSGKSTLINLTVEALRGLRQPPEIITFSPWLVGNRDDLLLRTYLKIA
jgi:predicted KAP-like P-loop ATPase